MPLSPVHEQVLTAQSALDTTHSALFLAGYNTVRMMVVSGAGVASGAVTLEAAHTRGYTGTWKAISPLTVPAANTVDTVLSVNANWPYVRARISTVVVGGTIDVTITAGE